MGEVLFKFLTSFKSAISVSTNRKEYAKLRQLITVLTEKLQFSSESDGTVKSNSTMVFTEDTSDGPGFVLEPQLNIMGEATSTVLDWYLSHLDVDKKDIPANI